MIGHIRPGLAALVLCLVGWSIIITTLPNAALNSNGLAVKRFWQAALSALNPGARSE